MWPASLAQALKDRRELRKEGSEGAEAEEDDEASGGWGHALWSQMVETAPYWLDAPTALSARALALRAPRCVNW